MTIPDRSDDPRERVKRPEPIRTRPARGGWLDLFGGPGATARTGSPPPGPDDDAESPDPTRLTRAVELGYRVVDDYIRQGQNAARLVAQRAYGPQALQQDAQDVMTRMFEYTSELAAMWFDFVGTAATGWPAAGANRAAPVSPFPRAAARDSTPPAAAASAEYSTVSVYVEAERPVTLRTDLRPIGAGVTLRVQPLRAASPELPLLDDLEVSCSGAGAPVVVRIGIPRNHPPGTYVGVIVDDATNVPVGTIQVRIAEPV